MKVVVTLLLTVLFISGCLVPNQPQVDKAYIKGKSTIYVEGKGLVVSELQEKLNADKYIKVIENKSDADCVLDVKAVPQGLDMNDYKHKYQFDIKLIDRKTSKVLMNYSQVTSKEASSEAILEALTLNAFELMDKAVGN